MITIGALFDLVRAKSVEYKDVVDILNTYLNERFQPEDFEFDEEVFRESHPGVYEQLNKRCYSLILNNLVQWSIYVAGISAKDAAFLKIKIQKHPKFNWRWKLEVVPDEAAFILQGLDCYSVFFKDGAILVQNKEKIDYHKIPLNQKEILYSAKQYLSETGYV